MRFRPIFIVVVMALPVSAMTHAAANDTPATDEVQASVAPAHTSLSFAYRQYMKDQADALVGMTRLLSTEIRDGNLDAAQSAYAPAHRYFKRIEPIARLFHDLDGRMDAHAADYEKKQADPNFSGFHRIEYALFANRSTASVADYADRLYKDAQDLRTRIKLTDISAVQLVEAAAQLTKDTADQKLTGDEEPYSRTDLWDLEANIDGVQNIVALARPQLGKENTKPLAQAAIHFAEISALLEKHKAGCGFKTYDEISTADKIALKAAVAALADELSTLRTDLAMD